MGSPFCAICDKEDNESNLRAAGTEGATKDAVDTQHNTKLAEQWKDMAIKVNNDSLLARLGKTVLHLTNYFMIWTVIRQ